MPVYPDTEPIYGAVVVSAPDYDIEEIKAKWNMQEKSNAGTKYWHCFFIKLLKCDYRKLTQKCSEIYAYKKWFDFIQM